MAAAIATGRASGSGGVELAYLKAGPKDGPVVLLLHGFPEFSYGWRPLMAALAAAGFHAVAPDQRGYGGSGKPKGVSAYDIDVLVADVLGLMDHFEAARADIVGHDWGAIVGWWAATRHPERVRRLVALAAGHPAVWRAAMRDDPEQRKLSGYVRAFQIPWLPETLMRAGNFKALTGAFGTARRADAFTDADLAAHRTAWSQPGALTGMVNWYRAIMRRRFEPEAAYRVTPPTLMLWGARDRYGVEALGPRSLALCDDGRLKTLDASHWLQHDEPKTVAKLVLDFLDGA